MVFFQHVKLTHPETSSKIILALHRFTITKKETGKNYRPARYRTTEKKQVLFAVSEILLGVGSFL
jgi:hypothetical protein